MPFRLTPALLVILLAGCTSSEPQNVSYAPLATQPVAMQPAPLPSPSMPQGDTAQTSGSLPAATATASMSAWPTEDSLPAAPDAPMVDGQAIPATEPDIAAGVPAGATNCSTVDGVTLCDAPYDPAVDATRNTN